MRNQKFSASERVACDSMTAGFSMALPLAAHVPWEISFWGKAVWLAQLLATRVDQQRMDIRRPAVIFVASIITASCSEKPAPDRDTNSAASETPRATARESEPKRTGDDHQVQPPSEGKIGKDCVAFVRSTKVVPAQTSATDCPGCPAGGREVLSFRQMKTDAVSCSGDTCNVVVTIRAVFNPGSGTTFAGGLTAWIPPEQRKEYLSGRTPSDEQVYRVQIIYKRRGEIWRAVEFDRAPVE